MGSPKDGRTKPRQRRNKGQARQSPYFDVRDGPGDQRDLREQPYGAVALACQLGHLGFIATEAGLAGIAEEVLRELFRYPKDFIAIRLNRSAPVVSCPPIRPLRHNVARIQRYP